MELFSQVGVFSLDTICGWWYKAIMQIRTHTAGFFGWLCGDSDVYEYVDDDDIEDVYFPDGSTG